MSLLVPGFLPKQSVQVSGGHYPGMFEVVVCTTTKHKPVVLIEGSEDERMLAKRSAL